MRKLLGIGLAGLLGLSGLVPALAAPAAAQEAVSEDVSEDVLGQQVRRGYEELSVETRIDLVRALVARGQLLREMARVAGSGESEAVAGERVQRGELTDQMMQEMLEQLRARAELDQEMGALPGGWQSMPR